MKESRNYKKRSSIPSTVFYFLVILATFFIVIFGTRLTAWKAHDNLILVESRWWNGNGWNLERERESFAYFGRCEAEKSISCHAPYLIDSQKRTWVSLYVILVTKVHSRSVCTCYVCAHNKVLGKKMRVCEWSIYITVKFEAGWNLMLFLDIDLVSF